MRLMAHREREGGGVRKRERTQHSSGPREKQTIIIMHQFDCEAAATATASRLMARRESDKRQERGRRRERENI